MHNSNSELGRILGVTHSQISRMRTGNRHPSLGLMDKIEKLTGWSYLEQADLVRKDKDAYDKPLGQYGEAFDRALKAWSPESPVPMPDPTSERHDILAEADELVHGDRNASYGHPTINFDRIAGMWNIILGSKLDTEITAAEVADMMIATKLARNVEQPKRDNYVDIAGYAACGWEAYLHTTDEETS